MKGITKQQLAMLLYIYEYIKSEFRAPTIVETMEYFDFKSPNTVVTKLAALEKKGYIERKAGARGIKLVITEKEITELATEYI